MEYFTQPLPKQIDKLVNRIRLENKFSIIIIVGGVGLGKTTLGVHIANYINKQYGLDYITLDIKEHPQYCMGANEFKHYIDKCQSSGLPCLVYDEAGDYDRRNAMGTLNKEINRLLETARVFKVLPILCLPDISVLDKRLFGKGIAIIHILINRKIINDKGGYSKFNYYNLNRTGYILKRMDEMKTVLKILAYRNTRPNFKGVFWNLDTINSKKLDELSMRGKKGINAKARGLLNKKEIAYQLDISPITVRLYMNKLGIKPHDKIGRDSYYNEEQIQQLKNIIKRN